MLTHALIIPSFLDWSYNVQFSKASPLVISIRLGRNNLTSLYAYLIYFKFSRSKYKIWNKKDKKCIEKFIDWCIMLNTNYTPC
jgi:hypothetical protein